MQVMLKIEGGFAYIPILQEPLILDSMHLPKQKRLKLARLVRNTRFFSLPQNINAPARGSADLQQYTLTIHDGEHRHSVRFFDPVENDYLMELVNYIRENAVEADDIAF
jgi:hypothetical protein